MALSRLPASVVLFGRPWPQPDKLLIEKEHRALSQSDGEKGAKFESRASRPRPIESEYDGFSRLRVQSAEARMAEVCNGGRSRLCSVLLDFSEKSLNGACRRPSERGQFLGTFC